MKRKFSSKAFSVLLVASLLISPLYSRTINAAPLDQGSNSTDKFVVTKKAEGFTTRDVFSLPEDVTMDWAGRMRDIRDAKGLVRFFHQEVTSHFPFKVAFSLQGDPRCQGSLGNIDLLLNMIGSLHSGDTTKYVRMMVEFEKELFCMGSGPYGHLSYDLMLAAILRHALDLPDTEKKKVIYGLLNAALLVFDLVAYTGTSAIQLVLTNQAPQFRQILNYFPAQQVGLWVEERGKMIQLSPTLCQGSNCNSTVLQIFSLFENPRRFGTGKCSLYSLILKGSDSVCKVGLQCDQVLGAGLKDAEEVLKNLTGPRATLDDLARASAISRLSGIRFGLEIGESERNLCMMVDPGAITLLWGIRTPGLFDCLLAERDFRESQSTPSARDQAYVEANGGQWDPQCGGGNPFGSGSCGPGENSGRLVCRAIENDDRSSGSSSGSDSQTSSGDRSPSSRRDSEGGSATSFSGSSPSGSSSQARTLRDRAYVAFLGTRNDLKKDQNIHNYIRQQCAREGVRSCDVDQAILDVVSKASLFWGESRSHTNADTFSREEWGWQRFMIRISSSYLASASVSDLQRGLMHELLHGVYNLLKFDPKAGPQQSPGSLPWWKILFMPLAIPVGILVSGLESLIEGKPIGKLIRDSWDSFFGKVYLRGEYGTDHHKLIYEIVGFYGQGGIYQPTSHNSPSSSDGLPDTCSGIAERARNLFSGLRETARGVSPRGPMPGTSTPDRGPVINPTPDAIDRSPAICDLIMAGSPDMRPSADCGLIHCDGTGACRCGGSGGVVPTRPLYPRNFGAIDCLPDQEIDPMTSRCANPTRGSGRIPPPPGPRPDPANQVNQPVNTATQRSRTIHRGTPNSIPNSIQSQPRQQNTQQSLQLQLRQVQQRQGR